MLETNETEEADPVRVKRRKQYEDYVQYVAARKEIYGDFSLSFEDYLRDYQG